MSAGLASLPADVRELLAGATDEQLADLAASGDPVASAAAFAEAGRRDREQLRARRRTERREAARARRAAVDAAWRDAAYAEYVQAEAATRGCMLSPGAPARDPFPMLWTCSDRDFGRWASEEMKRWREFDASSFTRRADYFRQAYRPRAGEYPWHEAGPGGGDPGGLSVFTPAAQEPAPVAEPAPERGTPGGTGEDAPPPGPADSGASERAARRAERAREGAAMAGRIAAYAPEAVAGRVTLPPAAAVPAGLRRERGHAGSTGAALAVPVPGPLITPGTGPVIAPARDMPDAAALLGRVLEEMGLYLTDYVWFRNRSAVIAAVLWIAHAAARDAERNLIWWASPKLLVTSKENGSGKSTLFDLIAVLLASRIGRMVKVTPYGLVKALSDFKDVALPDDAQNTFGAKGEAARELLSIMIGSYTRGGTWVSGKSHGKIEPVFGPMAIAGKDKLITTQAEALADLIARSIIIRMDRPPVYMRSFDERGAARGAVLAGALAAVMGALQAELLQAAGEIAGEAEGAAITDGDGGRTAQIWRPLYAVARVAGGRWPGAARQAGRELAAASGDLFAAQDAIADLPSSGRNFWDE